ncbi:efflux RND transporter permease subunit [Pontiella agarivorans]|uniref:MMPL family transporter n=1 Tax=Pontiella agarivorans TaxID=3038953 RepID=A0ABU5MZW7_9BACT|nr:MMPL family transporter [Pontiella agarivorans]MDZ8119717.1 MMPL family transporter [Pontiella agarivorans]
MHKILKILSVLFPVLIAGFSARFASGLTIEQDNESMQSAEARQDPAYVAFRRAFDSEYELMLSVTREHVLEELPHAVEWLRSLDGVQSVYFPPAAEQASGFLSKDGRTAGLLITLRSDQSRTGRTALMKTLRTEAPAQIDGTVRIVGLPLLKERVARYIAKDQSTIIPLSIIVMMLMLALLFRRAAGVVLPMLVVGMSLITTLGFYAACGLELNSITSLLPPVVIVLSVSVAVHLLDAWNHAVNAGLRGDDAVQNAVKNVWKPCVFTAAMTAVGLLSLCFSPVPAVQLFGLFAAIGVLLSVVFGFTLLPTALSWTPPRPAADNPTGMRRFLLLLAAWPARYPKTILLLAALITALSIWAGTTVENNTDLIRFFKTSDPVYIAHDEVNRTLGSVRSLNLLIQHADDCPFNPHSDVKPLKAFTDQISRIPDVVRTDSVADFPPDAPAVPPELRRRFITDDGKTLQAEVHLGDIGSARASAIVARIRSLSEETLGAGWIVRPTGDYYQMVRDSNQLVATLLKSFALSLFVVMGSTCLLFRSLRVLIPAFIPNILPVIWGAGLMGLFGIDLSTGTTMVAAVVIGLAVDDTIHYLHHFQSFKHLPIREAVRSTTLRIGRALTVSSIVLVGGFWMGAFGSFIPTNTFALLTGSMMISALFCDLLVLPAYLILTRRPSHDE